MTIGCIHSHRGSHENAFGQLQKAIAILDETGERSMMASVHNQYGEALSAAGRSTEAVGHHQTALDAASDANVRFEEARAHAGLASSYLALGNLDPARRHGDAALAIFHDIEVPEAEEARAQLSLITRGEKSAALLPRVTVGLPSRPGISSRADLPVDKAFQSPQARDSQPL